MLLSLIKKNGLNLARFFAQTPLLTQETSVPKYCSILKVPISKTAIQQTAYSTEVRSTDSATNKSYKTPKRKRYGYEAKYFTGGLLPRLDSAKPLQSLKAYEVPENWVKKKALFGQNDYIDILGDGKVTPKELIRGPPWLKGFKGNEMQRLIRHIRFEGHHLRFYYPTKHHNIKKRIKYLYKFYNFRRHKTNY
ncbi:39S ribosomal protein L51, mitochondrial [Octopus bimaculoides]|uniref:Large ribosomal subunit protein mL51 n=1 Tax=Octopus bimaculoides TaxID=37653 RepID=A0A0L8FQ35_OCTBM|nr:39S ribosomal protein L51, mitochondrial [Octopus bimaculoides]|eukprot:XP_014787884.1 PREDICTED: 39S ribosomal protein L51, mitochondrial-like [Octopus bimaculoides]